MTATDLRTAYARALDAFTDAQYTDRAGSTPATRARRQETAEACDAAWRALTRAGEPLPADSCQACGVHQEHDRCTGTTTLGTRVCMCGVRGHAPPPEPAP